METIFRTFQDSDPTAEFVEITTGDHRTGELPIKRADDRTNGESLFGPNNFLACSDGTVVQCKYNYLLNAWEFSEWRNGEDVEGVDWRKDEDGAICFVLTGPVISWVVVGDFTNVR